MQATEEAALSFARRVRTCPSNLEEEHPTVPADASRTPLLAAIAPAGVAPLISIAPTPRIARSAKSSGQLASL